MTINIVRKAFHPRDVGQSVIVVASEAADIAHIDLCPLWRLGQTNFGICIQPMGTSVIPALSMYDPRIATDPANAAAYATVPWKVFTSITAQDIGRVDGLFGTVLRLTFAAPGMAIVAIL